MFPPSSLCFSSQHPSSFSILCHRMAEGGSRSVLTCTVEGQRPGGPPLAGPVSPPPGQASCPLETNRPLKSHKGCVCKVSVPPQVLRIMASLTAVCSEG